MSQVSPAVRTPSLHRIPSLDGLRALSILLVVGLHTIQRATLHHHVSLIWFALLSGGTGVYIFFVISGFLITSLLLAEQAKRGSISLSGFYFRRAFRILPPLYAYVGVLLLLGVLGRLAVYRIDILPALFFFHNYIGGPMWSLEHFWSLSVEEQFYFIWPVVLIACLRKPGIAGRYRAAKVALGVIAVSPVLRVIFTYYRVAYLHGGGNFHLRADALMFGCIVALLQDTPLFERVYRAATRVWWIPPATIFFSECMEARFENYWNYPFGFTVTGTAIAFFLLWCIRNPGSVVGRALNARAVVHIGVLSYSIYLWQTLFLHYMNASIFRSWTWVSTFPGNWLAILVVAEASYNIVEKPSLRLRNRLMSRFSPRHPAVVLPAPAPALSQTATEAPVARPRA